jgi:hypothetical protein
LENTPKPKMVPVRSKDRMSREFRALPPAKYLKLLEFARWQIGASGRKAHDRDIYDLLQQAILATRYGWQVWPENVSLYDHLLSVIRTLSRRKSGAERLPAATELLEEVQALFSDNIVDLVILDHMGQGYTPKQCRTILGLEWQEYQAAMKRIRRKLLSLRDRNPVER